MEVQEHIEKVKEELQKVTPGQWNAEGFEVWYRGLSYDHPEDRHIMICDVYNIANAVLIANSSTWLQTSIDLLEQQQREIDSNNELLERILKIYKNHKEAKYHNPTSIELIGKLVELRLSPNKEVSTE